MSRETSPYVVGEYWLDKRRDGATPDTWQITTYKPGSRQIVYRSTKCSSLDDAKGAIHAYVEAERSKQPQTPETLKLAPSLFVYWNEHGKHTRAAYAIAMSFRAFLGFLMQDEAGVGIAIADANPALFRRFQDWRMRPHSYEVSWATKVYKTVSKGVVGETAATNTAHVAAAINHQVKNGRIPFAPKVPPPPKEFRSPARDLIFTEAQMGALMAVASYQPDMFRFLALQLGTMVRPVAAMKFNPVEQYKPGPGLIDLQPKGEGQTKKRNPVVPAIEELKPILEAWATETRNGGFVPVASRKRAWRTLRRVLGLPIASEPKTIRHTVATIMRGMGVPAIELESFMGHSAMKSVTARYAKYDPTYLTGAKAALSTIWNRIMDEAVEWHAVHLLSKTGNGKAIVIDTDRQESVDFRRWNGGAAYRTRTCDPRITNARKGQETAVSREVRTKRSDN